MQIGIVGLGRMGANIARRLMRDSHTCVVYDTNAATVAQLAGEGAAGARSLQDMVDVLAAPRTIWLMLPAGSVTESAIGEISAMLDTGDILIDGGNAFYKDDIRRAKTLRQCGIHYVDVGTSGGVWGLERGYCLMIGGEKAVVNFLDPIFKSLAPGSGSIPQTPHRKQFDPRVEQG